jgi:hypothetical protein
MARGSGWPSAVAADPHETRLGSILRADRAICADHPRFIRLRLGVACVDLAAQTDLHRDAAQVFPAGTSDVQQQGFPLPNLTGRHAIPLVSASSLLVCSSLRTSRAYRSMLSQAPANNPETVAHRHFKTTAIQVTVRSFGDADEGGDTGICSCHRHKQSFDLVDLLNKFRPRKYIPPPQPNSHRLTVLQIPLPFAAAGREEKMILLHITHRLPVELTGLATTIGNQHQPPAERCRKRKSEQHSHGNVDHSHTAGLDLSDQRTLWSCGRRH